MQTTYKFKFNSLLKKTQKYLRKRSCMNSKAETKAFDKIMTLARQYAALNIYFI